MTDDSRRTRRLLGFAWATVDALTPKGLAVVLERNPRHGYRARTRVSSALPAATYHRRLRYQRTSDTFATPLEALEHLADLLVEARMDNAA